MKVYIAGPIRIGDRTANIDAALLAGQTIWEAGHVPFIPHLTLFWEDQFPRDPVECLRYDIHWLAECDALVRLPGPSAGSELEIAVANVLGIPVFYSVKEFLYAHSPASAPDS